MTGVIQVPRPDVLHLSEQPFRLAALRLDPFGAADSGWVSRA